MTDKITKKRKRPTVKKKSSAKTGKKFYYEVSSEGVRKRVYVRKISDSPRKKSLYSKFSSETSKFLKREGVSWKEFGQTYPQAISYLWNKTKDTYKEDSDGLQYAVNNIEESFFSIVSVYDDFSKRIEYLDDIDGLSWWELSDKLGDIQFSSSDNVIFSLQGDFGGLIPIDGLDLRVSLNVSKLGNELSSKITTRNMSSSERESLRNMGVPNSSDLHVSVQYDYDSGSDSLNAIISIPDLPKYLNYHFNGIRPSEQDVTVLPERTESVEDFIEVEVEDSSISSDSEISAQIELERQKQKTIDKELELIRELKELGLSKEQIRKRLGYE
jgi:hypothetical protein